MRRAIIILSIILTLQGCKGYAAGDSFASDEPDESYLAALLQAAKVTGMCGVFFQMGKFQDATQMQGGDEFILRFINTEATRLGVSVEEFFFNCNAATQGYKDGVQAARQSGL